jgi:hypothetical protein
MKKPFPIATMVANGGEEGVAAALELIDAYSLAR